MRTWSGLPTVSTALRPGERLLSSYSGRFRRGPKHDPVQSGRAEQVNGDGSGELATR